MKCFRVDPDHGDILFKQFVYAGSFDPKSKFHKSSRNKEVSKYDKLSHLDRQPAYCIRFFDPDGLLVAAASFMESPGDLDYAVLIGKRCVVSRDLRGRELLKIAMAFGIVFQHIKDTVGHGQFLKTLEAAGVIGPGNTRWAQRAMKLVREVPDPLLHPSVNAAIESIKVPKETTKRETVTISRAEYESMLKEISDLQEMTRDPATVDEVKRLTGTVRKLTRLLAVSEAEKTRDDETKRKLRETIEDLKEQVAELSGKQMEIG